VIAYSAWLAICVFAAAFLDGNRAYGAVLCGYTVSIVAIQQVDMPDRVFTAAVNRGAAIAVGIAAITFVNTVLSAPDITSAMVERVRAARARVRTFTTQLLHSRQNPSVDAEVAQILCTIADRHPEIGALSTETLSGASRAAAARAAATALVGEIVTARRLAATPTSDHGTFDKLIHHRLLSDLHAYRMAEQDAESALAVGRSLPDMPGMPIYRSWENAFRNGLRAFITSTLTGFGFVLTGWAATNLTWAFVGIVICLSATAPDPRVLARAALLAMPMSVAIAGVTLFIILDGSDAFPLLCASLSPALIGGALLLTSPNPRFATIGSLMTVFTLVVVGASNPQTYDPSSYATMSMLMIFATIIVYVFVSTLFPVGDYERRKWVLRSARHALQAALPGKATGPEAQALLLDASRIATLSTLKDAPPVRHATDLATLFWLTDLRSATQRAWSGLDRLNASHALPLASLRATILAALRERNSRTLRQVASVLVASGQPLACAVAGDVALAAYLVEVASTRPLSGPAAP
jgi:Fusaric acid resistance protein family